MQRKKVRWIILASITILVLLTGFHVISFVVIRSQANKDYEQVRSGESLNRAGMEHLALTDGGTIGWEVSGYRVLRLMRVGNRAESAEDQEILVGAQLEFTCRKRFPFMQRWLKDREDSKTVKGWKAMQDYKYTPPETGH